MWKFAYSGRRACIPLPTVYGVPDHVKSLEASLATEGKPGLFCYPPRGYVLWVYDADDALQPELLEALLQAGYCALGSQASAPEGMIEPPADLGLVLPFRPLFVVEQSDEADEGTACLLLRCPHPKAVLLPVAHPPLHLLGGLIASHSAGEVAHDLGIGADARVGGEVCFPPRA